MSTVSKSLHARSATLLLSLETRLDRILRCWLIAAASASLVRIAYSPAWPVAPDLQSVLPYVLLILAPFVSTLLALRWFADGPAQPQPATRLALVGRWRSVAPAEARRHPLYGSSGIMVSLILGMMINVPVRAVEYLTILPPIPASAPDWLLALRTMLTLDAVIFTSLYMVAFVAALRRVPLFPRLLAAIWLCDLAMQLAIGEVMARETMPAGVGAQLAALLSGNVAKVLVSIALWLPYLLLSTRVNVTYRSRVPA